MVEPGPWSVIDTNESNINSVLELSTSGNESNDTPAAFEDNFMPAESNTTSANESLPDSQEYIQVLEKRLAKLKRVTNYLDQLKARREHCIENLLVGNINLVDHTAGDNSHLEVDFEASKRRELLRYFQPEQANNLLESLAIVEHDELDVKEVTDFEATDDTDLSQ